MENNKLTTDGYDTNERDNQIEQGFTIKLSTFIVDKRNLFFLIFGILIIASLVGTTLVKVENDITAYLPDYSETRIGLDLMDSQFVTYGSCKVMIENISYSEAEKISDTLSDLSYVSLVQFDNSGSHYNNFSALYDVTFQYDEDDERCLEYIERLKVLLGDYDVSISTTMGDQASEALTAEIKKIIVYVAIIVLGVLFFTCTSFAEVPVLVITFLVSAVLAMGSNFLLGKISFVSNSVAIVLQLALSVDYAIIFCNRYKEEHNVADSRNAAIIALSKAIPEISASSLTTIGGLAAMLFMQFGIGPDLAIVLIKAIVISLFTVFFLMPGLIMVFAGLMDKTEHKNLVPKISFVGKFAYASRIVMPIIFVVIIALAYGYQSKCPYVYGESMISTPIQNESQIINAKIDNLFGSSNPLAVIIPAGDYEKEAALIKEFEALDAVDSVTGIANTEAKDGITLSQKLNAREFSELMDLDLESANVLYTAYAVDSEKYSRVLIGIGNYSVSFIDMFDFLYNEVQEGYLNLDSELIDEIENANSAIKIAKDQLKSENYSRLLLNLNLPQEGDETFAFLDVAHELGKKYYGEDAEIILVGNATSNSDLKQFFERDNKIVSILSILTVLIVLLFTFNSCGMPILLITVIEGCIWINFAVPTITNSYLFFLSYLVVSSIQMGANIDYAIVISSRYQEVKHYMSKKDAIIETVNFAFPTIITSGTMLASAGILIGKLTSMASICGVGQCIGRGTILSIIAVLFVLPQILLIGDKIIDKTSFAVSLPVNLSSQKLSGYTRVDGFVRGDINGYFVGNMNGFVKGDVALQLSAKSKMEGADEKEVNENEE